MFLRFQNVHQMSPHRYSASHEYHRDRRFMYIYIYIYIYICCSLWEGNALRAGCARSKAPLGSYLGQGLIPGSPFLPGCDPRHHNGRCLALYVVELLVHNQKTSQVRVIRSLNLSLSQHVHEKSYHTVFQSTDSKTLSQSSHLCSCGIFSRHLLLSLQ
jgi:hypothetical protein